MAAPTQRTVSKSTVLELLMLALQHSPLKEMGLDAMRSVLTHDPRLAVLDGAFDLNPVWDLFADQEGFDPEAARPAFCFMKGMETRLGVIVKPPRGLESLQAGERAKYAALCPVKREDVDKIVAHIILNEVATSSRPLVSQSHAAQPESPYAPSPARKPGLLARLPRNVVLIASGTVALASVAFLTIYLLGQGTATPSLTTLEPSEFAGDLPVARATFWAGEAHAVLADPKWTALPEAKRRAQLLAAYERLQAKKIGVLILEDDKKRMIASAQLASGKVQIRFY